MPGLLDGKIALVTGVSHDGQIGQTVARTLGRHGAMLGIAARSQPDMQARAKELEAETALFLVSPAAQGITGQIISVPGWGIAEVLGTNQRFDTLSPQHGTKEGPGRPLPHCVRFWQKMRDTRYGIIILLPLVMKLREAGSHVTSIGGTVWQQ